MNPIVSDQAVFTLHPDVTRALLGRPRDPILRYGLQSSRTAITGFHTDRTARFTATAMLPSGLEGWLKETTAGQRGNILVHTKLVVVDFTSDAPVVISGSHNLSKAASEGHDENFLVVRGDTDVADAYGCELMRFYDHRVDGPVLHRPQPPRGGPLAVLGTLNGRLPDRPHAFPCE